MRIVYLTLLLIVLLNIGNPCDIGLRTQPAGSTNSEASQ